MDLRRWGWDEDWEATWLARSYPEDAFPARVLQEHRDRWVVASGAEEQAATCQSIDVRPAVGDWVAVRAGGPRGSVLIIDHLPRRTKFARGAPGRESREQVVAANVDTVWIVHGVDTPLNPRRLERYVTLGWESGARPVIVLTKADLAEDVSRLEQTAASIAVGVPVRTVSTIRRETLAALAPDLQAGSTVALLGPSGAGKSTLANALLDRHLLRTRSVRSSDHKGRHTTTWRQLIRLESGALLIDTPGMREIQLWDVDEGIDRTFSDITELAAGCRYADCIHDSEPGCAVKEAVERGALDVGRLESFKKLLAEAAYQRRKSDARLRQEEVGRIKAIHKSLRDHWKHKHQ
jgi:ribosome biogenesis GTPase